jgi:hypothetical protein
VSAFEFTARKNRWANVEGNKILLSNHRKYLTGNRSEDAFISRIRIRAHETHTRLMKTPPQRAQPLYDGCGRVLTIKHLLVECTRYDGHRVRLLRVPTCPCPVRMELKTSKCPYIPQKPVFRTNCPFFSSQKTIIIVKSIIKTF